MSGLWPDGRGRDWRAAALRAGPACWGYEMGGMVGCCEETSAAGSEVVVSSAGAKQESWTCLIESHGRCAGNGTKDLCERYSAKALLCHRSC